MFGVRIPVLLLFVVFGWSSWIDVNGLWVELPLLVHKLPEQWTLPAYFTVIIQLANIGPLAYGLAMFFLKKYRLDSSRTNHNLETGVILAIIIIGAMATLMLSFYWDVTSYIGGVKHSTVLLLLVFFLSLVDCTSSVTFLPFLAQFKPSYMTAFYVGEGMSGLLPTAIAFIQGAGEYTCVNSTTNDTSANTTEYSLQPKYDDLLFPVKDFFLTLCIMLCLSIVAFSFLRFSKYCKSEHQESDDLTLTTEYHVAGSSSPDKFSSSVFSDDSDQVASSATPIARPVVATLSRAQYFTLLAIMTFICALANGVLPAIQIYSLLPYGQLYYSLGVKLATLSNPLACFLGFCLISKRFMVIGMLTTMTALTAVYIMVIASYSPNPPASGATAAIFMIIVWVLFTASVSYLKLLISSLMLEKGHTALFWVGVATQVGSCVGAIVTFLCTTVFNLLQSAPSCS